MYSSGLFPSALFVIKGKKKKKAKIRFLTKVIKQYNIVISGMNNKESY